jgi:hypothetical protein
MRHSEERCAEQRARHYVNQNQGKNLSGSSLTGFQLFEEAQDRISAFRGNLGKICIGQIVSTFAVHAVDYKLPPFADLPLCAMVRAASLLIEMPAQAPLEFIPSNAGRYHAI